MDIGVAWLTGSDGITPHALGRAVEERGKPFGDGQVQREAVEMKVWRPGTRDPLDDGLHQLDGYLGRLGLDTGTLVIFDRRHDAAAIPDRTRFVTEQSPSGRTITLLRA